MNPGRGLNADPGRDPTPIIGNKLNADPRRTASTHHSTGHGARRLGIERPLPGPPASLVVAPDDTRYFAIGFRTASAGKRSLRSTRGEMYAIDVGKRTMCRRIPRTVPSVQYNTETRRLSMKM